MRLQQVFNSPNPWGGGGNSGGNKPQGPSGGGNPWGGGNGTGNGGGRPSQGGGNNDDFVARMRQQARRPSGGGSGGGSSLIVFGIIVLVIGVIAYNSVYQVQQGRQAVVTRFGEFNRVEGPGLKFKIPNPVETAEIVNVSLVRETNIGFEDRNGRRMNNQAESLMLTGDQNIVDIDVTIQWRAADSKDYLFNVRDPEATVKIAAESALREVVGRTEIQQALSVGREKIELETAALLQQTLDEYQAGIDIERVQLQNVQAPDAVREAFEDVQKAQQDRDKAANKAEAYYNQIIPQAKGQADKIINEAKEFAEQERKRAEGEAQRFNDILSAYQENPAVTRERIFLDTMTEVYSNGQTLIIDSEGGGSSTLQYLPLPGLNQAPGQQHQQR